MTSDELGPAPDLPEDFGSAPTLSGSAVLEARSEELAERWRRLGFDLSATTVRSGTIVDSAREQADMASTLKDASPPSMEPDAHPAREAFELGPLLGEGGMGVVHLADQPTLRRKVAIKMAKPEAGEFAEHALLREARVTGALEHPNVIPIHALSHNKDGRIMLVMKRVEGRSWKEHLAAIDAGGRLQNAAILEQLEVLQRVAFAIHVAHLQGVVHRDIKPENVMLGAFGETYVVDWGIAASFRADGIEGLVRTSAVEGIEGTPGYMAPEMASGEGHKIDARSDVFLLGAVLHEVLMGAPPYSGATMLESLVKSYASDPVDYPDAVPSGLQHICHRAMARAPEDRYSSAAAFAEAIEEFRIHRASTILSDEANDRLDSLNLEAVDSTLPATDEGAWKTFNECRFAFGVALRSWPDNQVAKDGLRRVLGRMIDLELKRNAPQAAANLLRELPSPDPELEKRVSEALAAHHASQERLQQLERDVDISLGAGLRLRLVTLSALLWAGLWCVGGWLTRSGTLEVTPLTWSLVCAATAAVLFAAASSSFARRGYANEANTRLTKSAAMVFVTYAGLWLIGALLGLPPKDIAIFHAGVGVALWTTMTLNVDRGWYPVPMALAIALVVMLLQPHFYAEAIGLSGTAGTLVAALQSRRRVAAAATHLPPRDLA